ncbi:MAG: right-handed parallel beta-helix repeat-containing protein [Myxococcales bacterium]
MRGGARLRARLLLVLSVAGTTCERAAPRPPATPGFAVTEVFVSASAGPGGEGSRDRPFATLQEALSAAPAGAVIRLDAGSYRGPFVVSKPVVLAGSDGTRLELPTDARGPVIATDGNALELRDLAIAGSTLGIAAARTSLRLKNVVLEGQSEMALNAVAAEVDIASGAVRSIASGMSGKGLVLEGGTLSVQGTLFRRAARRAIELHGTAATVSDIDAAGSAMSVVQALEGSDVRVEGGKMAQIGGPALFGSGSTLRVSGVRISHAEYGILVHRRSTVELHDAQISDTASAGVGLVQSDGEVVRTTILRGGVDAAIAVTSAPHPVKLEGNRIGDPGTMGLHATNATIVATDNVFSGAVVDKQGDLGDAVFAVECNLTLLRNSFEGNAGSGATLVRSQAHLVGNRFSSNGRAGLVLLDRSSAKAQANEFSSNRGPAISVAERSHAMVARNRFADSGLAEVDAPCGSGGEIDLRANEFLGPATARAECP